MSTSPEADEVRIVLKDGTIARWTGDDASQIVSRICPTWYHREDTEENLRRMDVKPGITNPMRRVVEFDADYLTGFSGEPDGFFGPKDDIYGEPWRNMDRMFVPDRVCGVPGVIRHFRIEVEAEEVKT